MSEPERDRFVELECSGDDEIRHEVQSLLDVDTDAGTLFRTIISKAAESFDAGDSIPLVDQRFGAYRITGLISQGGMAEVYRAVRDDDQYKKEVAIKLIRRSPGFNLLMSRFRYERQILASLEHPYIARFLDGGTTDGIPYFVMEYIEGLPINIYCSQNKLSVSDRLQLFRSVCEAVQYAHRNLVIHRDLKPSNLLVLSDGTPKLLDFGIAKLLNPEWVGNLPPMTRTVTSIRMMTPEYASPEQICGEAITISADIYSLGAILFELLSGQRPYQIKSSTLIELERIVSEQDPVTLRKIAPNIPEDIETIVMKCLERDPRQRYESAHALAEDLKRYLEGDPVQARKPTLAYRIGKKVRKHKVMVAVSTISLLIALSAIAIGLYSWWRTNKQVRIMQEFSQQVEAMDWIMRVAHMSPLHNIQVEKNQIRERMKSIETKMKDAGSLGFGPGNYALGKGSMTLGNYEKAKGYLEKAWTGGYQTPETAFALGQTMGALYQRELEKAERIGSKILREKREKEITALYRQPAVKYLKQSAGVKIAAPEYLDALIALYDKRYDVALEKAQKAYKRVPWLYEATVLEGKAYGTRGLERQDKGDFQNARQDYLMALRAFQDSIKTAQSNTEGYLGLCAVEVSSFQQELHSGSRNLDSIGKVASQSCQTAGSVDPERADAHFLIAYLNSWMAEYQMYKGEDPTKVLEVAVNSANVAIKNEPSEVMGYNSAALALWTRGKNELKTGKNSGQSLQSAIANVKKALTINPNHVYALQLGGFIYMDFARIESLQGKDPRKSFRLAEEYLERVTRLYPDFFTGRATIGLLNWAIGNYEMHHGYDPLSSMTKGINQLNHAKGMTAESIFVYRYLTRAYRDLAEFHMAQGEDPSENLKEASRTYSEGSKLNPKDAILHYEASAIYLTRAENQIEENQSPAAELEEARRLLALSIEYNPRDASTWNHLGTSYLLEAKWKAQQKINLESTIKSAQEAFQKAIEINRMEALYKVQLAECYYWLSYSKGPKRGSSDVLEGLRNAEVAVRMNPSLAEAHGIKGMLLLLKSDFDENEVNKKEAKAAAEKSFANALKLNRYLERKYNKYM